MKLGGKIVSKYYDEEIKCGGCNWPTHKLFAFEGQNVDEIGMCGECFSSFLEEAGYSATKVVDVDG